METDTSHPITKFIRSIFSRSPQLPQIKTCHYQRNTPSINVEDYCWDNENIVNRGDGPPPNTEFNTEYSVIGLYIDDLSYATTDKGRYIIKIKETTSIMHMRHVEVFYEIRCPVEIDCSDHVPGVYKDDELKPFIQRQWMNICLWIVLVEVFFFFA